MPHYSITIADVLRTSYRACAAALQAAAAASGHCV